MKYPWSAKKILALVGAILVPLFCVVFFLPWYYWTLPNGVDADNKPTYGTYRGNLIDYFIHANWTGEKVFFAVAMVVLLVCFIVSIVMLIRSILANPLIGDTEDKNFVFGYGLSVAAYTFFGISAYSASSYGPMAVALGAIVYCAIALVIHFRKLSDF